MNFTSPSENNNHHFILFHPLDQSSEWRVLTSLLLGYYSKLFYLGLSLLEFYTDLFWDQLFLKWLKVMKERSFDAFLPFHPGYINRMKTENLAENWISNVVQQTLGLLPSFKWIKKICTDLWNKWEAQTLYYLMLENNKFEWVSLSTYYLKCSKFN